MSLCLSTPLYRYLRHRGYLFFAHRFLMFLYGRDKRKTLASYMRIVSFSNYYSYKLTI